MGKAAWGLATLAFLALTGWSQQPDATPPLPQIEKLAPAPADAARGKHVTEPPACPAKFDDSLATNGIAGKEDHAGLTQPKPKRQVNAEFSNQARREIREQHIKQFQAVSIVSFIVDVNGNPQDLCLMKPAGYGLDAQAAKAVWQYRFWPATKDGKPVPVRLHVEVNFRTY